MATPVTLNARLRGHAAMMLFSALVAGSFALGGRVANDIAPTALTAARFVLAALILGAVVLARHEMTRRAAAAPWRYALLGGSMGIYFVLMFQALKTVSPVSVSAVFTLTPIMSGVAGAILLGQHFTHRMKVALIIGAVGALWVIFDANLPALLRFDLKPGILIFAIGCAAHALYTPMVRKLNRGESPLVFSFGAIVAATVLVTLWGWSDIRATMWSALPTRVWLVLGYISVLATAISFVLIQYASLRLPSAKVMAYTYLVPVWVIVWELGLGAGLPAWQVMAGVVPIVIALSLLLKDEHPSPQTQTAPALVPETAQNHRD